MRTVIEAPQGTEEWLQARCGVPTASNFATAMGTGKTADSYLYKLAAEIITQEVVPMYQNDAMQRGNDLEPDAAAEYEFTQDVVVEETSLWLWEGLGASPDRLVGDDGLLEIKCPLAHTHVGYLDKGTLPSIYKAQVQGQMWITERQWCDFMSYHPAMPAMLIRVERDEKYIKEMAEKIFAFQVKLNKLVEKIQ